MSITPANITAAATAVQAIEGLAANAVAAGNPVTNAQKLQAAVNFIGAIDPTVGQWVVPAELLVNALVGVFNAFGIFKHGAVDAAH